MKTDLYTKTVLTVIAACLVWLSLTGRSIMPAAEAQNGDMRVVLTGWQESNTAGTMHGFSRSEGLPVDTFQR